MTSAPDYDDIATNSRDALAFVEALNRRDVAGANAIVANCNATALVEHLAAMVTTLLTESGTDPFTYVSACRARLDELGDDAINNWQAE